MTRGKSLSERWSEGERTREPFLKRAQSFAAVTLPYLAPDMLGGPRGEDLPIPTQSVGARGVSNLASRMTIGSFPTQIPFFKFEISLTEFAKVIGEEATQDADEFRKRVTAAQLALNKRQREIQRVLDTSGWRAKAYEGFLHLIVSGSYLFRLGIDGTATGFRLDQHQLERAADGSPEQILVREVVKRDRLPPEIRDLAGSTNAVSRPSEREETDLYTVAVRNTDGKTWNTWQEVGANTIVPDTFIENLPDKDLPWIPIRLLADSNEDYGRSFADLVLGDTRTHEGLTQALIDAAAQAARVVWLVDPSLPIAPSRLAAAETGEYLPGNGDLVQAMTMNKLADLRVAADMRQDIKSGLELAFLLRSAVRRQGERVTATEIREIAQELDETLGGVFSLLSQEFQGPLVRKLDRILVRAGTLSDLPEEMREVKVTTGIDAIGRGREALSLRSFLADAQSVFGDQVAQAIIAEEYLRRLAVADGIDPDGLVRSQEESAERGQQNQLDTLLQKIGPQGIKTLGDMIMQQQSQQQAQPQGQ